MKDQKFITTEGVGGCLEYTGRPLGADGRYYANRSEVRQVLAGFEVHDVQFKSSAVGCLEDRRAISGVYQSKSEAIQAVKDSEREWFQCVAEDLEDQRERQRIEAGHELVRLGSKSARNSRDIVDEFCDDGLTPKEALEIERQAKPFERLISDGEQMMRQRKLAVKRGEIPYTGAYPPPADAAEAYVAAERWRMATGRETALHNIERKAYEQRANDGEHRAELAREFRQAVDALRLGLVDVEPTPPLIVDWLSSAWRGSSGQALARPAQQEPEITR
jgi:hypothetical protein